MKDIDWQSTVTDDNERKIFQALADPQWDWRTVAGLTAETGVAEGDVLRTLSKYPLWIQRSSVRSKEGQELYTLKQRFYERKSLAEKTWDFLSPPSSSTST